MTASGLLVLFVFVGVVLFDVPFIFNRMSIIIYSTGELFFETASSRISLGPDWTAEAR